MKIGSRVGAVLGAKEGKCEFLGYGIYEGDFVPEGAVGFMAKALVDNHQVNPKICLDSGKVVWGCECWWGDEEKVKKILSQYKDIVNVDIDIVRKENV